MSPMFAVKTHAPISPCPGVFRYSKFLLDCETLSATSENERPPREMQNSEGNVMTF